jgi:hypothetical protein
LACHSATWLYAAEEATALGRLPARTAWIRGGNVNNLAPSAEMAMTNLPKSGNWNFNQGMPGPGTVMFWPGGPGVASHSAISTPRGIAGYNQGCICNAFIQPTHIILTPMQLRNDKRTCQLIAPITVVNAAVAANL